MLETHFPLVGVQRQTVEAILRHEVGHHVIARRLGQEATNITLTVLDVGGNYDGGAWQPMQGFRSLAELETFLKKRVQVLLAGALSESLKGGKIDEDAATGILSAGGIVDSSKANEFVAMLRGIRYCDAASSTKADEYQHSLWLELWRKTQELVEADHNLIVELAAEIAKTVVLGGKEYVFLREELDALPMVQRAF